MYSVYFIKELSEAAWIFLASSLEIVMAQVLKVMTPGEKEASPFLNKYTYVCNLKITECAAVCTSIGNATMNKFFLISITTKTITLLT